MTKTKIGNGQLQTNEIAKELLAPHLVRFSSTKNQNSKFFQMNRVDSEHEDLVQHWSQLSNIFDRFFFCIVSFLTLATTITLLLVCPRFSERNFEAPFDGDDVLAN